MSLRFENKDEDESKDDKKQQEDAFPFARVLLIPKKNVFSQKHPHQMTRSAARRKLG